MKSVIIFFFTILMVLFTGCNWNGFAYDKKITGKFHLEATDDMDQMNLCFQQGTDDEGYEGIIGPVVFAAGYNDKYIIVKQHPTIGPNKPWLNKKPYQPDTSITNYYILPIQEKYEYSPITDLIGPLTLDQFNSKRKELNIPDNVTFTKDVSNLEW
jgi:hypothetical protein